MLVVESHFWVSAWGMQLLFESSQEFGDHRGLGLIEGEVIAFDKSKFDHKLKVPHMGWNELFVQKETPLFKNLQEEFYLYFVHSYHVVCDDRYSIGKTYYGYEFVSRVNRGYYLWDSSKTRKGATNILGFKDYWRNFIKRF